MNVLTVSQLNFYIKSVLENDQNLKNVFISGEISNFTKHYQSGHMYFSLKDETGIVKAIIFSSFGNRLKFIPANGMKVIVRGSISLYEPSGVYQIYVEDMQPQGIGAFNLAFEQLKEKLIKEGLFDQSRKKPLPSYPEKVGVITSETGAVFFDIKNVLKRRYPLAQIVFYPVLVQGAQAPASIIKAIEKFNEQSAADVLIVGRGGGSIEDLWAFNDENVARAIAKSTIPVVSAVGHETDFTICDFVADLRAPTPSAAAELVVPDKEELKERIHFYFSIMEKMANYKVKKCSERLNRAIASEKMQNPEKLISEKKMQTDMLMSQLNLGFSTLILNKKEHFSNLAGKLEALKIGRAHV